MDIKAKIDELVNKIKNDPSLLENFQKDPVSTVESIVGVDLPNDQINNVVTGIKAKITADNISGAISGLGNMFKK